METAHNASLSCSIFKNDKVSNSKSLQIYGDSQLEAGRKIPYYFAEHFSEVINYTVRRVSATVDQIANPDVVVFSCSERYIQNLLTLPADIPVDVEHISDILKTDLVQENGYSGMWLDYCNQDVLTGGGIIPFSAFEGSDSITLEGWAADFSTMEPLSALYLQVGDTLLQCEYGNPRTSVVSHFGVDSLLNTGFKITFPTAYLTNSSISDIQFIQIGTDGTYQYAPATYSIDWKR